MLSDKADFVDQIKQSGLPFVAGRAPKAFQLRNDLTRFVLCEFLMLRSPSSYFSLHGVRSVAQWCPTLLRPHGLYCSPPGSSVYGIFQARILEWVAISYSRVSSQSRKQACISWSPALAGRFFTTAPPGKPLSLYDGPINQELNCWGKEE